ncbi:protein YebF [Hafnia alvei]|uniref:YebF-like protein n=1 Tax=Hafnia alvei TaxID=569 RepID=A0A1C6Z445_HAFAL|nr:protein YebF [Hafnia alvei]NLS55631.1 hypothetical protein [Hafnia alvei]SCM53771.1 YebF-like protein [Hafnia alvei]
MNKITLGVAGLALAFSAGVAQAQQSEQRVVKIANCEQTTAAQLSTMVKNDFLQNRIPRWADDKTLLGTSTPVVWVSQDQITQKGKDWVLQLTVRGNKVDKNYTVNVDCKAGKLEYSHPE